MNVTGPTPNDVLQTMQLVSGKWWTVDELCSHLGVFRPVMFYFLNRLMQQHLIVRQIGNFSGKTYYRVRM